MRRSLLGFLALALAALPTLAQEGFVLGVGGGIFDTAAWTQDKGDYDALEAGLVLRWPTRWTWGIGPMAGLSATDDGSAWVYLGARRPFRLGGCWQAGPTFAVSYYDQGDGKDLGHEIEFRSGLEVTCVRASGRSLGVEFYHQSNAGLADVNPGSNSLWVVYGLPLSR
jgi:lipid A 3-O-deacylase